VTAAAEFLRAQGAEGTLSELRARAYLGLLCGLRYESLIPASRLHHNSSQPAAAQQSTSQPASDGLAGGSGTRWPVLTRSVNLTLPLATWLGWSQSPGDLPGFGPWTPRTPGTWWRCSPFTPPPSGA
jgi:hypothetical protein